MDAWIGVAGAAVGALAALGGQWISAKTTERVAYRGRQHGVLDDLSRKLASVREAALVVQQSPGEDEGLVVALRALQTISPSIHDDELRKGVDAIISATYGFRVKTVDFEIVHEPFAAARERLTEVSTKSLARKVPSMVVLAALILTAACSGAPQGTTSMLESTLPSGVYDDAILVPVCTTVPTPSQCPDYSGPSGASGPYAIDVSVTGTDTFKGDVYAIAQDGSKAILFTFTAATQSGTASLTVTGLGAADSNGVWISSGSISTGQVLTASYPNANIMTSFGWPSGLDGSHVLTLDGCSNYLVLATTPPDCAFARERTSAIVVPPTDAVYVASNPRWGACTQAGQDVHCTAIATVTNQGGTRIARVQYLAFFLPDGSGCDAGIPVIDPGASRSLGCVVTIGSNFPPGTTGNQTPSDPPKAIVQP